MWSATHKVRSGLHLYDHGDVFYTLPLWSMTECTFFMSISIVSDIEYVFCAPPLWTWHRARETGFMTTVRDVEHVLYVSSSALLYALPLGSWHRFCASVPIAIEWTLLQLLPLCSWHTAQAIDTMPTFIELAYAVDSTSMFTTHMCYMLYSYSHRILTHAMDTTAIVMTHGMCNRLYPDSTSMLMTRVLQHLYLQS